MNDDIVNKEFPQNCGDTLKVLKKTDKKIGTNYLYYCQFQKYFYEVLSQKIRIIKGQVNNPQIEQVEFVQKLWPQHCGDTLRIIEKIKKPGGYWKCEFIKYSYYVEASKRDILKGGVNNPRIEEEEFIKKEWPQHCGDTLKIIKKSDKKQNDIVLFECQFLKYPYKETLFLRKDSIKAGNCVNPQLELNFVGQEFLQNCGDTLIVLEKIKKENKNWWKCKFKKYPCEVLVPNQGYFLKGNVVNPQIEQVEFIDKLWPQNCGDTLKVIEKSNKFLERNKKRERLWKCEFLKYPNIVYVLKDSIIKKQVVNDKIPYLYKEGLQNYILKKFKDKPTYIEVAKSLNISRTHLNHQIIKFDLKDLILFPSESQKEKEIREFCCSFDITTEKKGNDKILGGQEIDIYISSLRIGIEYNGNLWHSDDEKFGRENCLYHQEKSLLAKEKGIRLIHIFEYEWNEKENILKSFIKSKLGIFDKKIGASKCKVKLLNSKEYSSFCEENHLQGSRGAKVKLGLFYKDELVQVMSFGVPRFVNGYEWEIIRECSKLGYIIIGGKQKLWSYFVKNYSPNSVISYCDFSKFTGESYLKLGFKLERLNKPGFVWYDKNKNLTYWRNPYKNQEMKEKGYLKIYDAGQLVFTWFKDN